MMKGRKTEDAKKGEAKESKMREKKIAVRLKPLRSPLVSVIITIYNEAHCVDEAVTSMLAQTYKHFELILVNNGSTDATAKVIGKYAGNRRVKILNLEENSGPGGGRNAGAKAARGEILVFVDADMVFDKGYLKGLLTPVIAGKAVGAFHDTELVKNIDSIWARTMCINRITRVPEQSGVFRAVLRKPFLQVGGFNTAKGYFDDDLTRIGYSVPAHATCYHKNPDNLPEAYRHAKWIGSSLAKNKGILLHYLRSWALRLGIAGLVAIVAVISLSVSLGIAWYWLVVGGIVLAYLALLSLMALKRVVAEKYPLYFFSIPVFLTVRFAGYAVGFAKTLFGRSTKSR